MAFMIINGSLSSFIWRLIAEHILQEMLSQPSSKQKVPAWISDRKNRGKSKAQRSSS